METLMQDLRAALRGFARNRGFAPAVILTMALGIGANSAIFSVVHGVLLRPLPYAQRRRHPDPPPAAAARRNPDAGVLAARDGRLPPAVEDARVDRRVSQHVVRAARPRRAGAARDGRCLVELLRPLRRQAGGRPDVPRGRRRARRGCRAGAEQRLLEEPLWRRPTSRRAGVRDERSPAHRHWRAAADSAVSRRERRLHAGVGVPVPIVGRRSARIATRAWCRRSGGFGPDASCRRRVDRSRRWSRRTCSRPIRRTIRRAPDSRRRRCRCATS